MKTIKILHVDDNEAEAFLIKEKFFKQYTKTTYKITHCTTLQNALDKLEGQEFDIVLLDYCLGHEDGIQNIKTLRMAYPHIPIIVLTNVRDKELALRSLNLGIKEFLLKDDDSAKNLQFSVSSAIQRREAELSYDQEFNYCPLTGLVKQNLFYNELEHRINWARPFNYKEVFYVLSIDNALKIQNQYDQKIFNKVILETAHILKKFVSSKDFLAHLEEGIFCIIKRDNSLDDNNVITKSNEFIKYIVDILESKSFYVDSKKEFVDVRFAYQNIIYPLAGNSPEDIKLNISNSLNHLKERKMAFCSIS